MTHVSDESLSALLDGEAVASADLAHVDECGPCRERLEQLRGVTVALRAPTPLPASHLREAAVAVAVERRQPSNGVIRRLRPRRREQPITPGPARRMSAASAAAALVVALGVGAWALSQIGGGAAPARNGTLSALNGEGASTTAVADGALSASGGSADSSASYAGWLDAGHIGDFSDTRAVAAIAQRHMAESNDERAEHSTVMGGPDDGRPCAHLPGATIWSASLNYNGVASWARVLWVTPTEWVLEVRALSDCALIETQAIEPTTRR